jgi:hypothetical protein
MNSSSFFSVTIVLLIHFNIFKIQGLVVDQVVEFLPTKCMALSSTPNTALPQILDGIWGLLHVIQALKRSLGLYRNLGYIARLCLKKQTKNVLQSIYNSEKETNKLTKKHKRAVLSKKESTLLKK